MRVDKPSCKPWRPTARNTAFSVFALAILLAGSAQAALYRWVDGSGRVHYSDTPPTSYNQSGGAELNKQGQVIRRTQSEAERRAEAERQAEAKRIQAEQNKQAQWDRALTQTYTTEAEIDLARDRALEHHKLAIKSAEARAVAVDAKVAEMNERVARIEAAGRTIPANLRDELAQANKESAELKRTVEKNLEAMDAVRAKYEADKLRFRELTGKP
jgi:hypothetical protein